MESSVFIGIGDFLVVPGSVETGAGFTSVAGLEEFGIVLPPGFDAVPGLVFTSVIGVDVFDVHPIGIKNKHAMNAISDRIR
jgi:hypothetical protein